MILAVIACIAALVAVGRVVIEVVMVLALRRTPKHPNLNSAFAAHTKKENP